ncbi:hypothetical protein [Phaeobacter sp. JH18-37]|uniref:hypothetical protein n=1 Tax=Phaeobacter sp. JH18-37 TaxID=3112458 RepID=UPI003A8C2573
MAEMGSSLTCSGAAAEAQRNRIRSKLPDDASQPNHDIQAGRSAGAAASAKGLLKADLQACTIDPGDTAISVDVSDAQIATFAKSWDLPAGRRSYAARAMEWSGPSPQVQLPTIIERTGCRTKQPLAPKNPKSALEWVRELLIMVVDHLNRSPWKNLFNDLRVISPLQNFHMGCSTSST